VWRRGRKCLDFVEEPLDQIAILLDVLVARRLDTSIGHREIGGAGGVDSRIERLQ
jgi:hypothetical protein